MSKLKLKETILSIWMILSVILFLFELYIQVNMMLIYKYRVDQSHVFVEDVSFSIDDAEWIFGCYFETNLIFIIYILLTVVILLIWKCIK